MPMTKTQFLNHVAALYAVGNLGDTHDNPERPDWVKPAMAGDACCAVLDTLLSNLRTAGVFTADEVQEFYDNR